MFLRLHQQFGFCQAGTSAAFVGDDFAMIGSPGPYTWRGTAFGKVVVGDFLTKDKTIYHGPFGDTDQIDKYSYLGKFHLINLFRTFCYYTRVEIQYSIKYISFSQKHVHKFF